MADGESPLQNFFKDQEAHYKMARADKAGSLRGLFFDDLSDENLDKVLEILQDVAMGGEHYAHFVRGYVSGVYDARLRAAGKDFGALWGQVGKLTAADEDLSSASEE